MPPVPTTNPTTVLPTWLTLPDRFPGQADLLQWCQTVHPLAATLLLALGILYLLCGWYMYKVLLTFNATVAGAMLGATIGQAAGSTAAGALLGGFVTAVITWPLMKYTVALTGALLGALLGASLWHAAGLEMRYAPAGAAIGLTFFGLLSFIIFRASVVLFTSLQGSTMAMCGLLALLVKVNDASAPVTKTLCSRPFLMPMILFVGTVLAFVHQQTHFKDEPAKQG